MGQPCPGHPGWRGSVFGTMQTLWCARGGVGGHVALIISAMPRGRWPQAPRAAGGAGEALHCPASPPLRQERGRQARAPVSSEDQGVEGRQAGCGRTCYFLPLSEDLKAGMAFNAHRHTQHGLEVCAVRVNSACRVQILAQWLTKTRSHLFNLSGPPFSHL